MKSKFIFCLALMLVIYAQTFAQDERRTYVGVKGGYNSSGVNWFHSFYRGYDISQDIQHGYTGGIVVMNFLRNNIGIQGELNYTQKGYIQRFVNAEDYSEQFNYLELPFLFNLHTGKDKFHLFFNAGCFFEYLLSVDTSEADIDNILEDEKFYPYDPDRDPNFGYGFRGGVGSFYDSRIGTFMLEASFTYSLSNHIDPPSFDSGEPTLSNHMVVGITLGYLVSFGTF